MAIKFTQEEFITKANSKHKGRYSYEYSHYINSQTKLEIICHNHSSWSTLPNNHLRGSGCPECAGNKKRTTISFIAKAKEVHGDRYDYSSVLYTRKDSKVQIRCRIHGEFKQGANSHLLGNGCPSCASYGFNKSKPATLYFIKIFSSVGTVFKIGITNRTIKARFRDHREKYQILSSRYFERGEDAVLEENRILKKFAKYRYKGTNIIPDGNTELFTKNILLVPENFKQNLKEVK